MPEDVHSYRHEAMNTWFEVSIAGQSETLALSKLGKKKMLVKI